MGEGDGPGAGGGARGWQFDSVSYATRRCYGGEGGCPAFLLNRKFSDFLLALTYFSTEIRGTCGVDGRERCHGDGCQINDSDYLAFVGLLEEHKGPDGLD